jgi:disease resistance protein RPM1
MAELIAISLSAKVAVALSRTATVYHLASLVGIRSGIGAAARDLELLRAFLRFADSRRGTDELANAWVDRVRHVGFDLEDAADEYSFLLAGTGVRACADVAAWFALATRLRKAREQLRALSAAKEQYGIRLAEASSPSDPPPRGNNLSEAAHFVGEEEIVGFGAHKRLLMKWLTGDADPRRTIVAVCGMGGVGKTTLATNVYRKVAANCHFDCAAWVNVSRNFTTDDLLRRILKELHRGAQAGGEKWDVDMMDYRSLVEALRALLAHKRFFILLDDVWDADAWFQLRTALPDSPNGSRIVITTRSREVAALGSTNRTIMLEPLPEHEAWSLFCSTAFREDADRVCPHRLHHWASKILDRCYGLPLAIVSVGNLMALKDKTEFAWKNVYDSLAWDGQDHRIGQVSNILNFSIDDLPYHLKRCFLCCSVYPEDMFIKRKILIRSQILTRRYVYHLVRMLRTRRFQL